VRFDALKLGRKNTRCFTESRTIHNNFRIMRIFFYVSVVAVLLWPATLTSSIFNQPKVGCSFKQTAPAMELNVGHIIASFVVPTLRLRGSGPAKAEEPPKNYKQKPMTEGLQLKIQNKDRSRVRRKQKQEETKSEAKSRRKQEKRNALKKSKRMAAKISSRNTRGDVKGGRSAADTTTANELQVGCVQCCDKTLTNAYVFFPNVCMYVCMCV
jgi:hypothetical protein